MNLTWQACADTDTDSSSADGSDAAQSPRT